MSAGPRLAVSVGEPAGIGPDIVIRAAPELRRFNTVLLGDPRVLRERAAMLDRDFPALAYDPGKRAPGLSIAPVPLVHPCRAGRPDARNAPAVLAAIERGVEGCLSGEFDALVTGPVNKAVMRKGGLDFMGHTEYLARLSGAPMPVMLLACETPRAPALSPRDAGEGGRPLAVPGREGVPPSAKAERLRSRAFDGSEGIAPAAPPSQRPAPTPLRVALATTHIPLRAVPDAVTRERLNAVLTVLAEGLRRDFGIAAPRIAVLGLNPHAGEDGELGSEDRDVVAGAIDGFGDPGVTGPWPADTAFAPHNLARQDAVLAMYHDQGLPVIKHAGFGVAVNVTLGLPFVRTSVDHGTAFDLAGTGRADEGSLAEAVAAAARLARRRAGRPER